MKARRNISIFLCLMLILGMVAGCSKPAETPAPAPTPTTTTGTQEPGEETPAEGTKYKEEIIIAIADEFTAIDPTATTDESNQLVQGCVFDLLTNTNLKIMANDGEVVESWEMIAPDHWKFKIYEDFTFHNGSKLTVDDILFTFERDKDLSTTSAYIAKMKEVVKIDDYNFEVFLHLGDVDFNYVFSADSLAIMSKEAFETMPEEDAVKIGTGPWMFEEFVPGDYVSLVRFEDSTHYPVPNTKRLVFRMIPEASARMIALENGEVDVILAPSAVDYTRLSEDENLQLLTVTGRGQHFVGFNLANKDSLVSDPAFRKAIAQVIDKEEMVIAAWDGYAQVSTGIMARDMEFYAEIEGIPYDPVAGEEALKALGAEGKTISLITSDANHRVKMAESLQAQLSQYGITLKVEFMQQAAFIERLQTDPKVEMFVLSWTPGMNADYMFRNPIHSSGGRSFYANLNSAEIDKMIDDAAGETDKTKRAEMYKALQERLTVEEVPWIPIAQATITMGARAGVEGILLHPALVHDFNYVQQVIE